MMSLNLLRFIASERRMAFLNTDAISLDVLASLHWYVIGLQAYVGMVLQTCWESASHAPSTHCRFSRRWYNR